ncbi:hypothetical protein O6H91_13G033600 [Diphasiastrum complanatum]|uniref:Uncharacterized protein n=1 Tax=Diphasiastrum complanatum TaxID=34168 RepID=A0ACC2BTM6_DIPCM|nr:hypothetical protein O6H91_13G033600 [Diphasiastrum complanatum]
MASALCRQCLLVTASLATTVTRARLSPKALNSCIKSVEGLRLYNNGTQTRNLFSYTNSRIQRFRNGSSSYRQLVTSSATSQQHDAVTHEPPLNDPRVPITVITGFLGSGKTTLLNHVLTAEHGKRIAVIENEYGEVDIDGSLVAVQKTGTEDIMMLNNGCLCCTVRGDLVRMIKELLKKKRDKFDHILIETTGLANPSPIIQTFYMEESLVHHVKLDGVVTLVDAKHAPQHLDEVKPAGIVNEAVEQIAYADRILLNKIDLVGEPELDALSHRIKRINEMARIKRTKFGVVDMDFVLGVGGFDVERVVSDITQPAAVESSKDEHSHDHDEQSHEHEHHHDHDHEHSHGNGHAGHEHTHHHDPGVSSLSIQCEGSLDLEKVDDWLGNLVQENADDLYRMKGVLSIEGVETQFIFQGVHALLDGINGRPWRKDEKRTNKIVFIGKNLDKELIKKSFFDCLVPAKKTVLSARG